MSDDARRRSLDEFRAAVMRLSVNAAKACEAFERMAAALAGIARRKPRPAPRIPRHGFTPNLDLVCRVCGTGPEECNGGRTAA